VELTAVNSAKDQHLGLAIGEHLHPGGRGLGTPYPNHALAIGTPTQD